LTHINGGASSRFDTMGIGLITGLLGLSQIIEESIEGDIAIGTDGGATA